MLRSWRLGSLFGIGIYVHSTFVLLPLFVAAGSLSAGAPVVLFVLALVAAVFGCVVLHELGHALMARRFGIRTLDITLYPIGGVARLDRMTDRPGAELAIALAGPAVNVAIAALLAPFVLGGLALLPLAPEGVPGDGAELAVRFLFHLLMANVVLVVFNLMPTFPMDGGRVVRALLAYRLGLLRATEVAVAVGRVFLVVALALLFVFVPSFLTENPTLLLVAVFVFLVGSQELAGIRRREAARREVRPEPVLLPVSPEEVGVAPGFSGFTWDQRSGVGIRWQDGRPVGTFFLPAE